jgi:thiol-disulfide isomerase/thioredoxin
VKRNLRYKGLICLFALLGTGAVKAQIAEISNFRVGDTVPNLRLILHTGDSAKELTLMDIKKKLIILDFWGVHCSACIARMPELERLQQQFNQDVQILLVTKDAEKDVRALISRSKIIHNLQLPVITGDSILSKMFPSAALGLNVWIDSNLVVRQKTDEDSYSSAEVATFLSDDSVKLLQRRDYADFNWGVPLWLEGNGREIKRIKYHSYIADHVYEDFPHGIAAVTKDSVSGKPFGIRAINIDLLDLITIAFGKYYQVDWVNTPNRMILEIRDSSRYFAPPDKIKSLNWYIENSYCYDLAVPISKSDKLFQFMQQDLERYFDLDIRIVRRSVNCIALVKKRSRNNTDNGASKLFLKSSVYNSINRHKMSKNIFIANYIQPYFSSLPIVDNSGSEEIVNVDTFAPPGNYEDLIKQLHGIGFDLIETHENLNMLLIKENNNTY